MALLKLTVENVVDATSVVEVLVYVTVDPVGVNVPNTLNALGPLPDTVNVCPLPSKVTP